MKPDTIGRRKPERWIYPSLRIILFLGFSALAIAPMASQAGEMAFDYNLGPALLEVSSQAPGQSFRYSPIPCVNEAIVPESAHVRLGSSLTNIFTKNSRYDLDYGILHARFSVSMA